MQDQDLISQYRTAFEDSERARLRLKRWKAKEYVRLRGQQHTQNDANNVVANNPTCQRFEDDALEAKALYLELAARVRDKVGVASSDAIDAGEGSS
jgi:hypothetical protein